MNTSPETPTPRTDEAISHGIVVWKDCLWVSPEFARQLERELLTAQAELAEEKQRYAACYFDWREKTVESENQLAAAKKNVEKSKSEWQRIHNESAIMFATLDNPCAALPAKRRAIESFREFVKSFGAFRPENRKNP